MKLVRFGPMGQEQPGLIDEQGSLRDLSAVLPDIGPAQLSDAVLDRLRRHTLLYAGLVAVRLPAIILAAIHVGLVGVVADLLATAVVVVDDNQAVLYMNPAAENLFEASHTSAAGLTIERLLLRCDEPDRKRSLDFPVALQTAGDDDQVLPPRSRRCR